MKHFPEKTSVSVSSTFLAELITKERPEEIAEHVCDQLRKYTDAHTVAFIQSKEGQCCSVVRVSPRRRANSLEKHFSRYETGKSPLCPCNLDAPLPFTKDAKESESALQIFIDLEVDNLFRCPIIHDRHLAGILVFAGLGSEDQRTEIEKIVAFAGPSIGLAMAKSEAEQTIIQQNKTLENKIKERTQELEEANAQLRRSNLAALNMLEDMERAKQELEASNEELNKARKAAESSSRVKSEFLSVMSHELRTPLNPIIGFTEIMLETESNENTRQCLEIIHKSACHQETLISDILDYTQIDSEQNPIKLKEIQLREMLEECIEKAHTQIENKNLYFELKLTHSAPASFMCDPQRIRQVVNNLLTNAVRYSTEGPITLSCESNSDFVVIAVEDHGIGMRKEEIQKIFEPFYQVDSSRIRKVGGLGIGLSIVQKIAASLNAPINVTSVPDQGSRFEVFFPKNFADQSKGQTQGGEVIVPRI